MFFELIVFQIFPDEHIELLFEIENSYGLLIFFRNSPLEHHQLDLNYSILVGVFTKWDHW